MQAQAQILPDRSISVDSAMEVVHQAETGRHTVSEGNGSTRIWVEVAGAGEQELHEGEVVIVGEGAGAARSRVTELRYRIEGRGRRVRCDGRHGARGCRGAGDLAPPSDPSRRGVEACHSHHARDLLGREAPPVRQLRGPWSRLIHVNSALTPAALQRAQGEPTFR
jgi:hypothetical protein